MDDDKAKTSKQIMEEVEERLRNYKPTKRDNEVMRKAGIYPMLGGICGSLTSGYLSNKYLAPRVPSLPMKIVANLFVSSIGFFAGTIMGTRHATSILLTSDAPIRFEFSRLYEYREKNGLSVPSVYKKHRDNLKHVPTQFPEMDEQENEFARQEHYQQNNGLEYEGYKSEVGGESVQRRAETRPRSAWDQIRRENSAKPVSTWDTVRMESEKKQDEQVEDDDPFHNTTMHNDDE